MVTKKVDSFGQILYPSAPFQEWLERLVTEARSDYDWHATGLNGPHSELCPEGRVAARCEVTPETLRGWRRNRFDYVRESTVDRACSREGSMHIGDLYPQYWQPTKGTS